MSQKCIQVSSEGHLFLGGEAVKDAEFCLNFMKTMHKKADHICYGRAEGEDVAVEAKSFPLVVKSVEKAVGKTFKLQFSYGHTESFEFSDEAGLFLDDWSRLCGFSQNKVPFVFSLSAQTDFLSRLVEVLEHDCISIEGEQIELKDWYLEHDQVSESQFWSERYTSKTTPWDLGRAHPALEWVLPRLKLSKSQVLVPGCGRGYDAQAFAKLGHPTTGLDFSDEAHKEAKALFPALTFKNEDVFRFAEKHQDSYDVVFEHTLFCALNPRDRSKLIKAWTKLLRSGGDLIGVFMVSHKRYGPPFGVTEWELEELLSPHFNIQFWGRLRGKESARAGKELFVYAKRKEKR